MPKASPGQRQYRWWLITYNNPPADWQKALTDFQADYVLGQLEKGENGTRHIQAVLYFSDKKGPMYWTGKKCWSKGITQCDALTKCSAYCSKDETRLEGPFEAGDRPRHISQTNKLKYREAKKAAREGRFEEIDDELYVKYYGNLKKIAYDLQAPYEHSSTRGIWVYGESGFGKSHYARTHFSGSIFIKSQNKWFDGYAGEQTILLDDFDESGQCLAHHLKIWLDKWSCSGEVKHGYVQLWHHRFVITSQYWPNEIWPGKSQLLQAIERRCSLVVFTAERNYTVYDSFTDYVNKIDNVEWGFMKSIPAA